MAGENGDFSTKKTNKDVQFKIRRKSDILKALPESLRKKLGTKNNFCLNPSVMNSK